MKVEELLNEGPLDYLQGVGQHVGGKIRDKLAQKGKQIMDPIYKAHAAGQKHSARMDAIKQSKQEEIAKQKQEQSNAQAIEQAKAAIPGLIQAIAKNMSAATRIMKELDKLPTNEGLFDYLRGAAGATKGAAQRTGRRVQTAAGQVGGAIKGAAQDVGSSVKRGVRNVHTQGQRTSLNSEMDRINNQLPMLGQKLAAASIKAGLTKNDVIKMINQQYGNPNNRSQPTSFSTAIIKLYVQQLNAQQPPQPQQAPPTQQAQPPRRELSLEPMNGEGTPRR